MVHPNIKFLRAVGTMVGSVVGVGVFGLPYAFAQSGFVVGAIWLLLLAALLTAMQLMYAEVAVQTEGSHRLVGYVRAYLGEGWGRVSLVCLAAALWGAMIAYLIIGGHFLFELFGPIFGGPEWVYGLGVGVLASWMVHHNLKIISRIEVYIICALLLLFAVVVLASLPYMDPQNLLVVHAGHAFGPYGVVLFSLAGMGIIPEMKDVLGRKQERHLPRAVMLGMTIITALYFLFALAVVGATGALTTPSAFDQLSRVLGPSFGIVGSFLGLLCIVSIYMILGVELKHTLTFDFRVRPRTAYWFVVAVPVGMYLLGVREFINVVGFVGGVLAGMLGIIVVMTYEKMRQSPVCERHRCLDVPHVVSWLILGVFAFGIVLQLMATFGTTV